MRTERSKENIIKTVKYDVQPAAVDRVISPDEMLNSYGMDHRYVNLFATVYAEVGTAEGEKTFVFAGCSLAEADHMMAEMRRRGEITAFDWNKDEITTVKFPDFKAPPDYEEVLLEKQSSEYLYICYAINLVSGTMEYQFITAPNVLTACRTAKPIMLEAGYPATIEKLKQEKCAYKTDAFEGVSPYHTAYDMVMGVTRIYTTVKKSAHSNKWRTER